MELKNLNFGVLNNMESTGKLHVQSDDLASLKGKHVLIVEDIIDTGNTLTKFCTFLLLDTGNTRTKFCIVNVIFFFL